jgi:virginiamycin B lyase
VPRTPAAPTAPIASPDATPGTSAGASPASASDGGGPPPTASQLEEAIVREFDVARGSGPHDVAPARDGGIWYSGQRNGTLGHLLPATGEVREVALGPGSAPHGVIVDSAGTPWLTDSGLNAIVRVDPATDRVDVFPLPERGADANLNTAVFDPSGTLWFTGQNGVYGRLDPATGEVEVFDAPGGPGPYGIAVTPAGDIWYASLAGDHIARVDTESGTATVVEPPTADQGARRIWADSAGRLWVSEYDAGQVARYDPADGTWQEWRIPGERPQAYAVYVDEQDDVWLTDFGGRHAIVRFDPGSETFTRFRTAEPGAAVRQLLGRPGEVWGAASAQDRLVVVTRDP